MANDIFGSYTDQNGIEWHCETFADYLYCASQDAEIVCPDEKRDYDDMVKWANWDRIYSELGG